MTTRAAVLWGLGEKWDAAEVELDPPGPDEVMVRLTARGSVSHTHLTLPTLSSV